MTNIKFLKSISRTEVALFGGKGSSLGELAKLKGIKVPEAFVLNTKITKGNLNNYKKEILQKFAKLKCQYVAVRSSATKEDSQDSSFAGQFDTFLNVDKSGLFSKIIKCYNSLSSSKILNYCKSKNLKPEEIKVAIVVQKMIQSEISGIAFSVNPINNNKNEIMVEAGYGLGEYIVSGVITPDKYIFSRKTKAVLEKKINYQEYQLSFSSKTKSNKEQEVLLEKRNAQKLPSHFFKILLDNIFNIEKKYQKPVDIEWAIADGILYITQARPITTLK
ncbi:MAG: PEP/pyruvate-binding domain-containing protein [Planctomycetes bacterium]|jgi:pyruvate,water dikinase|nr:PEP/pyruvate-binding domain-containing protein [Planctomycetota bacterium]